MDLFHDFLFPKILGRFCGICFLVEKRQLTLISMSYVSSDLWDLLITPQLFP